MLGLVFALGSGFCTAPVRSGPGDGGSGACPRHLTDRCHRVSDGFRGRGRGRGRGRRRGRGRGRGRGKVGVELGCVHARRSLTLSQALVLALALTPTLAPSLALTRLLSPGRSIEHEIISCHPECLALERNHPGHCIPGLPPRNRTLTLDPPLPLPLPPPLSYTLPHTLAPTPTLTSHPTLAPTLDLALARPAAADGLEGIAALQLRRRRRRAQLPRHPGYLPYISPIYPLYLPHISHRRAQLPRHPGYLSGGHAPRPGACRL